MRRLLLALAVSLSVCATVRAEVDPAPVPLLFATVEDLGHTDNPIQHGVACANLATGDTGFMPWAMGWYVPWHIERNVDESGNETVVATTDRGRVHANGMMTIDPFTPGTVLDEFFGTHYSPAAYTYVARGWKAAIGHLSAFDPSEGIQIVLNRHDRHKDWDEGSGGKWVSWQVHPTELDPSIGSHRNWKTSEHVAVDTRSRKILGASDGNAARWILVDVETRSAEVFAIDGIEGPSTRIEDFAVDLASGLAVVVLAGGGSYSDLYCYEMNGSLDPREWDRAWIASIPEVFDVAVHGRRFYVVSSSERKVLVCEMLRGQPMVDIDQQRYHLPVFAKARGSMITYVPSTNSVVMTVGPAEELPGGGSEETIGPAMCVIKTDLDTGRTIPLIDLRPGSPLNPDGRRWHIHDCVATDPARPVR